MPVMVDPPRRRGHAIGIAIVVVAVVVVAFSFALPSVRGDRRPEIDPRLSPFEAATKMLGDQARALLAGDEDGWLAPVDPGQPELRTTYRSMFESLRALDVVQFSYRPLLLSAETDPALSIDGKIAYCFAECSLAGGGGVDPADAHQRLTVKRIGGRPLITDMVQYQQEDNLAPAPWESGPLVFQRGARVTVAAPRGEAGYLDKVLTIAEQGAETADRFAGLMGNPQRRYRVYLADESGWQNWYGGLAGAGIAYTRPLPGSGADIVLRIDEIGDDQDWLPFTLRSQIGRVVTLGQQLGSGENDWLTDGLANWIGWWPRPAGTGPWAPDVRSALHGAHPPKTIAQPSLNSGAPAGKVRASFGLGQFAADCMAKQYGEPALFAFAKGLLQEQTGAENAAQAAFHKPFAQVDQGCMTWIRQQVA
jgi:hypothetical protein